MEAHKTILRVMDDAKKQAFCSVWDSSSSLFIMRSMSLRTVNIRICFQKMHDLASNLLVRKAEKPIRDERDSQWAGLAKGTGSNEFISTSEVTL